MRRFWFAVLLMCPLAVVAQPIRDVDRLALEQQCVASATGRMSATPGTVDRWTSLDRAVDLSWSVSLPSGCPASVRVGISPRQSAARSPFPRSDGLKTDAIHHARWFALSVSGGGHSRVLDRVFVQVKGDPGFLNISAGSELSSQDLQTFNAQWMQPYEIDWRFQRTCNNIRDRNDAIVWEAFEFTLAMVRMYELTRDPKYAKALGKFADYMLSKRNDRHPQPKQDEYRGDVSSAWGASNVNTGGYFRMGEITSSLYGYSIAAYARIVLENPTLRAVDGDKAIGYVNEIGRTAQVFMPQMRNALAAGHREAVLTQLQDLSDKPTQAECEAAADAYPGELTTELANCKNLRGVAGKPFSYNEVGAYMMMLTELWRASNAEAYQQSTRKSILVQQLRVTVPLWVARFQRFFWRHLSSRTVSGKPYYVWHHADEVPRIRIEDTNHAALDMTYLGIVHDNSVALNAHASNWNEPLPPLGSDELSKFANTFLLRIARGENFNRNVAGDATRDDEAKDEYNGACDGWAMMARGNPGVFAACRRMFLRNVSGTQPYAGLGVHAALLKAKGMLSPQRDRPPVTGVLDGEVAGEDIASGEVELRGCTGG